MDFCAEWLNHLLSSLDENCDSCLFENCAKLHYQVNGMDNILEKYVGNLPSFISFLEKGWGWEITYSEDGQQLFSRVCQKNISAKVKRSVLRDGQSCIYEISGL